MAAPYVAAEAPTAWVAAADVARPPIADSSGATWDSWQAWKSPSNDATLVTACAAAPVPGWVEDMRPAFAGRGVALAGATASGITGFGVETFDDAGGAHDWLGLRAAGGGPTVGHARTFLGFGGTNAHACFVVCAGPNGAPPACNDVVVRARLEGGDAPPRPGILLRGVTWAVHHPSTAATAFAAATVLGAVIAIATRRKPRARA